MKYTTATILAGLTAGVTADGWKNWSSASAPSNSTSAAHPSIQPTSEYCPKEVTTTITETETGAASTVEVWQTTVSVTAPETKYVTVGANGKASKQPWEEWKPTSSAASKPQPTHIPSGCVPSTHTLTHTESVKKPGSVTTKTGSTLFVGVGQPKTTVTITESAAVTPSSGSGSPGTSAGSGNPGKAHGDGKKDDAGLSLSVGGDGIGIGIGDWGVTISEKLIATGTEAFKWTLEPTGVTKTFVEVPTYTKKADGKYGFNWGDWGSWGEDGKDGSGGPKRPDGPKYPVNGTHPGTNTTAPGTNSTGPAPTDPNRKAPLPGSEGSNVTAPFDFLSENSCNTAGDRSKWCNGRSVSSNIYTDNYRTGKVCAHELTLTNGTADFDGEEVMALLINGQSPGPLIECNWGDTVQVTVHNKLQNNGTSIHWHGFRMTGENDQDGVPGVTECPLAPGESRVYSFLASSYGTAWYHSHWMAQSGDGIKGPIVIHGPATANYDVDAGPVEISDTFETTATQWNYLTSKIGPLGTKNYLLNGYNTQSDLSSGQHALWTVESGKKYLFRFINAASQNMFSVSLDGHKMKVIAADFTPVVPYDTQWLNIGIGQRYDVVIEMNQKVDSYFLRAVTQTGCPSQCDNTGLGQANGIVAYKGVQSDPYLLPTSTTKKQLSDFVICDDEPLASLVPYVKLGAGSRDLFTQSVETIAGGDVSYVETSDDGFVTRWFLNNGWQNISFTEPTLMQLANGGKTTPKIDNSIILNKKDAWYYFVIQNQFFAGHPMHLHGHDFSILGQGSGVFDDKMVGALNFNNPMRRDTGMLKGVESKAKNEQGWTVIGFQSNNPGAWLMHCHIIWHVDGGLSLQWIERPDEITTSKYVDTEFKDNCKAYSTYEAKSPAFRKTSGQSGLKRSVFFEERVAEYNGRRAARAAEQAKREAGSAEREFLAKRKARRGIGSEHHYHM